MEKSNKKYLVKVTFLDHCSTTGGISEPIKCVLYGVLIHSDKTAHYIASWISDGEIDHNTDSHTILKKAVIKLEKIRKE